MISKKALSSVFIMVAGGNKALATMIVIIYTKDGFWLAADSYRSLGDDHQLVCKIHETPVGLIVKSGNTQGLRQTGASYSTDKEVKDLSEKSAGTRVFEDTLRILFKRDVQEELAFLVDDPEINGSNIDRYKMQNPLPDGLTPSLSRTVILFDLANQDLIGKALVVQPASDRIPNESDTRYKYWAPSLFGWHPANDIFPTPKPPLPRLIYPPSVHQFAYLVSYGRTDDWVQKNPDRAIREILRKGHSQEPHTVGPPYVIVHVVAGNKGPKVKWISRGLCPSWSLDFKPDDFLLHFRAEQRKQRPGQ